MCKQVSVCGRLDALFAISMEMAYVATRFYPRGSCFCFAMEVMVRLCRKNEMSQTFVLAFGFSAYAAGEVCFAR